MNYILVPCFFILLTIAVAIAGPVWSKVFKVDDLKGHDPFVYGKWWR